VVRVRLTPAVLHSCPLTPGHLRLERAAASLRAAASAAASSPPHFFQDILDCSWQYEWHNETNAGCAGGSYQASIDWARDHGMLPQQFSPYANNDSTCATAREDNLLDWRPQVHRPHCTRRCDAQAQELVCCAACCPAAAATDRHLTQGWVEVPDDEALIKHALAHVGPLAVSMLTAYPQFDKYPGKGAIVVPPENCTAPVPEAKLDHSMFLVGYGTSPFGAPPQLLVVDCCMLSAGWLTR